MRRAYAALSTWCVALATGASPVPAQAAPPAPSEPAAPDRDAESAVIAALKAGTPSEAEAQARALVAKDTKLAGPWAIVALSNLTQGVLVQAVSNVARAGELDDRDPFVQRTAGAILGAIDGAKTTVPDRARAQINTLRHNMKGEAPFDEAYAAGRKAEEAKLAAAAPPTAVVPPSQVYAPEIVNMWVSHPPEAPAAEPVSPLVPSVTQYVWNVAPAERSWNDGYLGYARSRQRPGGPRSRGLGTVTGLDFTSQGVPIYGAGPEHAQSVFRSIPAPGSLAAPGIQHIYPRPASISVGPTLPPPTGPIIPHPIVPPPRPIPHGGAPGPTGPSGRSR